MAWVQADLDRIEAAIACGEMSVQVNGRLVTYRSITELLKARDMIRTALYQQPQTNPTAQRYPRFQVARFDDGDL